LTPLTLVPSLNRVC